MKVLAKKMGRRLFSRGSLMAPVVLVTQTDGSSPMPPSRGVGLRQALGGESTLNDPKEVIRGKVRTALHNERRRTETSEHRKYAQRYLCGGLDPDIACLQSLPYSTQVRMQLDRQEMEAQTRKGLVARIAQFFGADPDEFY